MNIAVGVLFIYVIVLAHNSSNLTGDIPQLNNVTDYIISKYTHRFYTEW